jgi:hypothetical protein
MSSTAVEKPSGKGTRGKYNSYTQAEREAALAQVVRAGGLQTRAQKVLKRRGIKVPIRTLNEWVEKEAETLERLREKLGPQINAEMAEMHQGLAIATGEIEAEAVEAIRSRLKAGEGDLKDLSAVQQRAAVGTGIHGEKHLLYTGQPNHITRSEDVSGILKRLKARGWDFEGEAVEVDAPAVESSA